MRVVVLIQGYSHRPAPRRPSRRHSISCRLGVVFLRSPNRRAAAGNPAQWPPSGVKIASFCAKNGVNQGIFCAVSRVFVRFGCDFRSKYDRERTHFRRESHFHPRFVGLYPDKIASFVGPFLLNGVLVEADIFSSRSYREAAGFCAAIQESMRSLRTSSGNAPASSTWSWKARSSNLSPSAFLARSRSSRILSWPIL